MDAGLFEYFAGDAIGWCLGQLENASGRHPAAVHVHETVGLRQIGDPKRLTAPTHDAAVARLPYASRYMVNGRF